MPVEPRPRRLGRRSAQVDEYLRTAERPAVAQFAAILDCFESGEQECWDQLPQAESPSQPGRMALLMTNGHIMVWQPYVDAPHLYAIFYIGPASPWV